jgi:glycosyltransferase domain-containing protein
MSLERLTIVVPTYNRQKYISRLIEFWSKTPVKLVVLDGSPEPHELESDFFESANLVYHHSPVSIEKRFGESIAFADTDYVALISDDEFFLPTTCCDCIQFLDQRLDFSACKGQAVGFGWDGRLVYGMQVYPELMGYGVNSENSVVRMSEHMAPYQMASLWAIQRKDVYQACMRAISSGDAFSSAAAGELQVSLISAFMGKIKVLDKLMWLRSDENKNIWWNTGNLSIAAWWRDSLKEVEHRRFSSSVALFAKDQNEVMPTVDQVNAAIEAYVLDQEGRVKSIGFIRKAVKKTFSKPQIELIKNILNRVRKLRNIISRASKEESLAEYVRENFSSKYDEVRKISEIVYRFHTTKEN